MRTLEERLEEILPNGVDFKALNIQSFTLECKSPIAYKSFEKPIRSFKIKHFMAIISNDNIILAGIEVYTYLNIFEDHVDQLIFVSKCDTSGLKEPKFKASEFIKQCLKWLLELNLHTYTENVILKNKSKDEDISDRKSTVEKLHHVIQNLQEDPSYYDNIPYYNLNHGSHKAVKPVQVELPGVKNVILSLFTRSSEQYLFPESSKNTLKHVLDGNHLLSWWVKVIDESFDNSWDCKLLIPGSDKEASSKFIYGKQNWSLGSVFSDTDDENSRSDLAVWRIPVLPDDPKGRFLENLVVENRLKTVCVDQFWSELGFRQEFRLGELVGIIGCEKKREPVDIPEEKVDSLISRKYKKFINVVKGEDYSKESDISLLVSKKIPDVLGSDPYLKLIGKANLETKSRSSSNLPINNLTSVARKREKPGPNVLTNMVRKKKKVSS